MRRFLDSIYRRAEFLAALQVVAILTIMLLQVGFGLLDRGAQALGEPAPGLSVPAYAEFCGFLLAGSIFLGTAGALRAGAHVRVTLLLGALPTSAARAMQIATSALACILVGYFTICAGEMALQSWQFGDRSLGAVSIPMWIPQVPMVLGLAIMTVALADLALAFLRDAPPPWGETEGFGGE